MTHLSSAIGLTIIGMSVVFLSLLTLMYVIKILDRIFSDAPEAEKPANTPRADQDTEELPLVLAAAAGYFLETQGADVFTTEVSRGSDSAWARRARAESAFPRRPR
ncbi:MAG: OadG family protein [Nitrospinaceae bacterium]|nr:OadG family protein [Nitrospinaceae bacterium]MBT3432698.1 OadG family protein [Nitrospinaceae bacterium]MBT3821954.1 OadG family protein [Nitrospinaceae bacterium]MBT4094499.1 OadG family protein [Nitrospinaceae bacterium]MBT4429752.1 OadG family protein [Nitrospinaceae bacterium]